MEPKDYYDIYKETFKLSKNKEIALAIMQECGKDKRTPQFVDNKNEPATDSQKKYMRDLGVEFDEYKTTKAEAILLIDKKKGKL